MRILIHGTNYAPELVGIGRYTGETGAWLAKRGHRVTVLTAVPYYPQWRVPEAYRARGWIREWLDGVEVLRVPFYVPARLTGGRRVLHDLSFHLSCLRWWPLIFSRSWDAILSICPPLLGGFIPSLLAGRQGIPLVLHFQDLQLDAARELGLLRSPAVLALLTSLESFLLRRATAVTTISRGMAGRLQGKGVAPGKVHLFPNWADLEGIQPLPRDNMVRRQLGLTSEVVALYGGNLGEKQGLDVILESALLTRERPEIHYVIAGDGAAKSRLRARSQALGLDKMSFLPLQSQERFPWLLAAGDIHLVIQRAEAADLVMPSKLTNILAAGRPFIATALPGTELGRAAAESQAGLLIPPGDSRALAQAVTGLASREGLRREMGRKGRDYAEKYLSRTNILSGLEDLLHRLSPAGHTGAGFEVAG